MGIIIIMIIDRDIVGTSGSSGSAARGTQPTHDVNNYEDITEHSTSALHNYYDS